VKILEDWEKGKIRRRRSCMAVDTTRRTPSFALSLGVFAVAAFFISYGILKLEAEAHMPILAAAVFAALVGRFVLGVPWKEMEEGMINNIAVALQATLILMIIGMIIGAWIKSGVVPGLIYYGLMILKPSIFLLATLLTCSVVSLATGSSWTTTATIGIAMLGIGNGLGVPVPITAGVIISGAYFGDKMSPLSDTTNLAPAVSGAELFDHIKAMVWTTGPTYIIVLAVLTFIGFRYGGGTLDASRIHAIQSFMKAEFPISLACLIPPFLVIALAVMKMPAIPGLFAGLFAGIAIAFVTGAGIGDIMDVVQNGYAAGISDEIANAADVAAVAEAMTKAGIAGVTPEMGKEVAATVSKLVSRGGLQSMMWSISLIFVALSFGGIMEACGFLETIIRTLTKGIRKVGTLITAVVGSCIISNIFLGDQYLSLVVPGRMFRNTFLKAGLAPRMLSRTLEDAGTLTSALVPWNTCGAYQTSVLGVGPLVYGPYAFLNWGNPLMAILLTYMKIGIYWRKEDGSDVVEKKGTFDI